MIKTPSDPIAAAAAMAEVDRLIVALSPLAHSANGPSMSHLVYAYLSEATWWIAGLDEQFCSENPGGEYVVAREASEFGKLIPGILWIRDRISHQLPSTVVRDTRSLFEPKPGGVLHISGGYEWLPIEQIRPGRSRPAWERVYREHFERQGIVVGPARAASFLRGLLERDPDCATELERIAGLDE